MWPKCPFPVFPLCPEAVDPQKKQQSVCVCFFWFSNCDEWSGCGCVCEEGRPGWGTQHTYMTWAQLPLLHNNNNRRRDVFCGEEEARDGRLKRKEEGKKIKWKTEMKECKGERIRKHWEEGNRKRRGAEETHQRSCRWRGGRLRIEKTTENRMRGERV